MVLLSGCGTFVRVQHPWVVSRVGAPDLPGLGNLYVVVNRFEPPTPSGFAGSAAGALLARALGSNDDSAINRPLNPREEAGMLRALSTGLARPWIELAGWSVGNGTTTRFLGEIQPAMVLEIKPGLLEARQNRVEVGERDNAGRETGKRTVFRLWARFEVSYKLKEWPSGREVASGKFNREAAAEAPEQVRLSDWLGSQGAIRENWIRDLYRDLVPMPFERTRRVMDSKKSSAGYSEWNAGVASEKSGDWAGARLHYSAAFGGLTKKNEKQELQTYISELDRLAPYPQALAVRPLPGLWAEPVAILPFANDSNNIPAPEELRKATAARLVMMGYRVVPLENTDLGLRARGVTLGEHLRALKPGEIAPAAGANRLIGGKVEVFSVINVGIYYKREVRVRLWMLESNGLPICESVGTGFMEVSSDKPAETFLSGLFGGLGEKMTGTYLKEEGNTAVLGALGVLPARQIR